MLIKILNWERFNPRKDVKNPSWFRLSHNIFEDHDFYDFTHSELVAWIYILSSASKKNSDTVRINLQHLDKVGRIKTRDFYIAIEKLKFIQCITVDDTDTLRPRYANDTSTNATNERNERNERTNKALNFDLTQSPVIPFLKETGMAAHPPNGRNPVSLWIKAYAEKYDVRYALQKRDTGMLKNFGAQYGPDAIELLFACYLAINEPFYANAKHPLSLFFRDLQKISVAAQTGIDPSKPQKFDIGKLKD